eukprot:1993035-Rhodomonas_salina.1
MCFAAYASSTSDSVTSRRLRFSLPKCFAIAACGRPRSRRGRRIGRRIGKRKRIGRMEEEEEEEREDDEEDEDEKKEDWEEEEEEDWKEERTPAQYRGHVLLLAHIGIRGG